MGIKSQLYLFFLRKRIKEAKSRLTGDEICAKRVSIESYQVKRFNAIWTDAVGSVPFYRQWQERYGLPDRIHDLSELARWPVLTKEDVRDVTRFYRMDCEIPRGRVLTGGSTGTPVRLPVWKETSSGVNQLIGRKAYGIKPGDKTVLLWGHEHLYGKGVRRKINAFKRRAKDWLSGWTRISAYDLSTSAMQRAYAVVVRRCPKVIIGFSPAVLSFVRHNACHAHEVSSVKVILCTAGPLSVAEKHEVIDFFTSSREAETPQLCMEYGSVECGVMAYTCPDDDCYHVFWRTHLLQTQKQTDGEYRNLVTRLTGCYVPLIRYDVGDYLDMGDACSMDEGMDGAWARSVLKFRSVKGRPSEMLRFACGVAFFGALIGDCVKQVPEVCSSQIAVDEGRNELEIRVTANSVLCKNALALIKDRFCLTVANAEKLTIRVIQVDKLFVTEGGKTPRVVRL